jgi:transcriptional regulator GlxA family with amidase domain
MDNPTRQLDVLLFDGLNILDVAGPVQTFSSANSKEHTFYRLRHVSVDGRPVTTSCGLKLGVDGGAAIGPDAQDLLIPGGRGVDQALDDPRIGRLITDWYNIRGDRRIISVCSGALLLANTGVLNGLPATTHWSRRQQVRRMFPDVAWDINRLYCNDGHIMTSAGVTSGIDLALAIVRQDCGTSVALRVARELVVYLKRAGGQDQFADLLEAQFSAEKELVALVDALLATPQKEWPLGRMADFAGLTSRTLTRRFAAHLGQTPAKFLERIRVKRAADALSAGAPVGRAMVVAGFSDFQQMQRAFKRQLGSTVGHYQQRFSGAE